MSTMDKIRDFAKSDTARLCWCAGGVIGTLLLYGIMQERIMRVPYGPDKEEFPHSLFIVLCNRVLTASVAVIICLATAKPMAPVAPIYSYGGVSLSNVVATTCQYEALKYVSFPVQTLAKSAKMIPVMIWGTAIMQKKYGFRDYLIAAVVTAGCAVFLLMSPHKSKHGGNDSIWGVLLMIGYLGFDGFTSTFQDKLFKGYNMETFNQILYISLCSAILSFGGLVLQGTLLSAIGFMFRYPECLFNISLLSMAATVSQFFISETIRSFGALIFAIVMTTRQLISIMLSSVIYGPPLTAPQMFGTVFVFGALYYKAYAGKPKDSNKDKEGEKVDPESVPLVATNIAGKLQEEKNSEK